jgi:pimeloyl-ACP methyl ester carboxylesterase
MNRSRAAAALVVLIPVGLFAGLPIARYLKSSQETLALDAAARQRAPGAFVQLDAGMTHYQLGGPPGGPPVLLINGFSTPYNIWDPTFDALTRAGFRVLRYDLFGRGWSDRPDAAYDVDFFVGQAAGLLKALGIEGPVDAGGVSMGGAIAASLAARFPQRVRRVMLFDPAFFDGVRPVLSLRAPLIGEYNMAVRVAPGLAQSQWKDFAHPERFPDYLQPYHEQMRYRGFRRALLATMRNYMSQDTSEDFRALGRSGRPVLLVWGRNDKNTPLELSQKVRAAIPQAEFHVVEEAAHIPHYEYPEIVNPLILRFLSEPR